MSGFIGRNRKSPSIRMKCDLQEHLAHILQSQLEHIIGHKTLKHWQQNDNQEVTKLSVRSMHLPIL